MTASHPPTIAVLGAAGLIGEALARGLGERGFAVVPIARRFTPAQRVAWQAVAVTVPIVDLAIADLSQLLADERIDIVVNCLGVLQDGPRGGTDDVHRGFVERLLAAIGTVSRPILPIHVSIPGTAEDDRTAFALTKRAAEAAIVASDHPFVILRPGFVVASAAYGGSALIRAVAALPVDLPQRDAERPFAATDIRDLVATVAEVARRWHHGDRDLFVRWDVLEQRPGTVGDVIAAFRRRFGGPSPILRVPGWAMDLGARLGDLAAWVGWSPPIRSTALAEMRRGVTGDPTAWIAATGIEPTPLATCLADLPATVQERWFARLYLLKALVIAGLSTFWLASGLVALTFAFAPARAVLMTHGVDEVSAGAITVVTALADVAIGLAIAGRRTCRAGLVVGFVLAIAYLVAATILAPELWLDPLGALVKIGPAALLMLVALAVLDDR